MQKIIKFLDIGSGYGYGDGDGSGYGDGDGSGDGSGYGYGSGSGYGDGIKSVGYDKIYTIDGTPTIIRSIHGQIATGYILQADLTLTKTFVARVDNSFAHGGTAHQAYQDALSKSFQTASPEERIARFKAQYPDPDSKIPAKELYIWHNRLTGSCEAGRQAFAYDHSIDIENDSFTIREFVGLTSKSYGGEIIRKLL